MEIKEALEELRKEMELYEQMFYKHVEQIDSMLKDIIYMVEDSKDERR